jgi:FtsP/CotA-like multicopper oxidase with cupredoxin domain
MNAMSTVDQTHKRGQWPDRRRSLCVAMLGIFAPGALNLASASAPPGLTDICTSLGLKVASATTDLIHSPAIRVNTSVSAANNPCSRPQPSSLLPEPTDLRSSDGVLALQLSLRNVREPDGSVRYCYTTPDGTQSPTLRVQPGDLVVLRLKNELKPLDKKSMSPMEERRVGGTDACNSAIMSALSTNLHFHGMTMPPTCHQDEALKTSLQPGNPRFEYRFRVPANEPPGLYWYHAHIHGFNTAQVMGGASGAIVVEGTERANSAVAGLPERVLVIRDQDLLNPDALPSKAEPVVPKMLIDRDGDSANNGTGFGKPAKDLSVNFVPVPYPNYPTARLEMRPGERQLWRVVNASSVTYLNLALLFDRSPQQLGIVAIDGVPLTHEGKGSDSIAWTDHVGLPPAARAEFIVTGPPAGVPALFVTRTVDTGQGGENDPNRALVSVIASERAAEPISRLPSSLQPPLAAALPWLGDVAPVRVRKLYFSERLTNPNDPNSATEFYLTVEGQTPTPFDPHASVPNIVAHQGDVEDWIIENRTTELHAFHIHQIHFELIDWLGRPLNEPFLRDTVNVPYYNENMLRYPSVRLRMDFRDPNSIGTFVYHCHLLEHEDGGMMGSIRVDPPIRSASTN